MRLCGQHNIYVCNGAGIAVIGEQEKNKLAEVDFYYPFLKGYDYTLIQECTIERHSDKESYAGIIDDYRLGIALIFYLTNGNVYNSLIKKHKLSDIKIDKIFLSALSIDGRIIMPVKNSSSYENEYSDKEKLNEDISKVEDIDPFDDKNFSDKIMEDIEDFSDGIEPKSISIGIGIKLPKNMIGSQEARLKNEDLYSIVETSFVPYGIESDKYQIVAEILSVSKKVNKFTNENLYEMRVLTMGLQFNLMINEKDIDGEPAPGRRFRGVIWLLGEVEFLTKFEEGNKEA